MRHTSWDSFATDRASSGEIDPLVLEFDHLEDKSFGITKGLRGHNWQSVLDEIASATSFVQTVIVDAPPYGRDSRARW